MEAKIKYHLIFFLFLLIISCGKIYTQEYLMGLKPGAVEIVGLRNYTSKTYINKDSSLTTIIFPYNIHFLNSLGFYEEYTITDNTTTVSPTITTVEMFNTYYDLTNNESLIRFGFYDFPLDDRTQRSYVRWNTSSVPVYANVSETRVSWYRSLGSSTSTFYINKIESDWGPSPTDEQAYDIWQDCGAGTQYVKLKWYERNPNVYFQWFAKQCVYERFNIQII